VAEHTPFQLADVLGEFVHRSGYTPGQLARLSGIPKPTIVNWLVGRVRRPRLPHDLLRLAAVLHLSHAETDALLLAAEHPALVDLRANASQSADPELLALAANWSNDRRETAARVPFQAMADLPTFVGREEELNALRQALVADEHKTVYSVEGMAGVGKTALVAHLTYQLRPFFPDGVLWARADSSDALSILDAFAGAYGVNVRHYGEVHSRSQVVRELLADKRVLVVLDNVRDSEQVKLLLPPTGPCAVVITTRRHDLSITRGAYRLSLGPFDPQRDEALALFARAIGPERVEREREAFVTLAEVLGHLPLAIDIAASRVAYEPGWSAADFLRRVRQQQHRLSELAYEEQSVRVSFAASYDSLTPALQRFFVDISIFPGEDFNEEAAAWVATLPVEQAQDNLRRLYGLSLIQPGRPTPSEHPERYRLHPLLRDYAQAQQEDMAVGQRFVEYYASFVTGRQRHYHSLAQEMGNILRALEVADESGMEAALVSGVTAFYHFLEARGQYGLAAGLLAKAKQAAERLNERTLVLPVYHCLGRLAQRQGDYVAAETHYEAALKLAQRVDDPASRSDILRALGVLAARQGDYGLADAYYREGLALARRLGHGGAASDFLRGLGVQAYMRGDLLRAEAFYEEGLALLQVADEGDEEHGGRAASTLWGLGVLAQEQGDPNQAESYYLEALAQSRELGHQERIIILLRSLGGLKTMQGDDESAETYLAEALRLAREIGHRWQVARLLSEWGELQLQRKTTSLAAAAFRELYEVARILHSQEMVAAALYGQARAMAEQGDWDKARQKARQLAEESLDSYIAIGHYKVNEVQEWLVSFQER
jgi:tetratricopeptide (TPR) repeat protein